MLFIPKDYSLDKLKRNAYFHYFNSENKSEFNAAF